jgi:hypothetical protein
VVSFTPYPLYSEEIAFFTYYVGDWMALWTQRIDKYNVAPAGDQSPMVQSVVSYYTDK